MEEKETLVQEREIDLLELFFILWNRKWFILGFSGMVTVMVAIHQLYIAKEIYRSDAKIFPTSSSGSSGMLGQLGGLASFVGVEVSRSENMTEIILNSRSLGNRIVQKFALEQRWECTFQEAIQTAQDTLFVETSKSTPLLKIAWEDEDPHFAFQVVEGVLEIVQEMMTLHASKKQGLQINFLNDRVGEAKMQLTKAEETLRTFQEEYEGVEIQKQAEALIAQIQMLRTSQQDIEIDLEITKKMMSSGASEVRVMDMTIEELRKKIDELVGRVKKDKKLEIGKELDERSLMEIPKIGLMYARKMREVKVAQKIHSLLLEQLEIAKIEAQKDIESFEVIDPPLIPEKRISPKRTKAVLIGWGCSGALAVLMVLARHVFENIRQKQTTPV
jgi:tyrosine-protein kinase Etk/Wzc